jgi:hypothetical protein
LSFLLFVVGPLVALYFIVKSAVRAGVGAASKAACHAEASDGARDPGRPLRPRRDRPRRLRGDADAPRNPVAARAYNPSGAIKRASLW